MLKTDGTFNWRYIKGTTTGAHAFAIAIDLDISYGLLALGQGQAGAIGFGNRIPIEIVEFSAPVSYGADAGGTFRWYGIVPNSPNQMAKR